MSEGDVSYKDLRDALDTATSHIYDRLDKIDTRFVEQVNDLGKKVYQLDKDSSAFGTSVSTALAKIEDVLALYQNIELRVQTLETWRMLREQLTDSREAATKSQRGFAWMVFDSLVSPVVTAVLVYVILKVL